MPSLGTWAFTRLLNGWVNSLAFYTRFIARLVSTQSKRRAMSYIDDVLLYSPDEIGMEMVTLLDKFLTRVTESGARINVKKGF